MKEKVYFNNLDSLRTIAFLLVFSEHILWTAFDYLNLPDNVFKHILYTLFCNGGAGVSVFFVISGFLITFLLLQEKEKTNKIDVKFFYVRRILRIWPLYFSLIIIVLVGLPLFYSLTNNPITNNASDIYYYLFISNFDVIRIHELGQQAFMQSSVTWSVSIEEQFYLLWPILFFLVPKRFYLFIFIFFILLGICFRAINYQDGVYIYFHTLGNCADLAIGGLSAWLIIYKKGVLSFFQNLKSSSVYFVYFLGLVFVLLNDYYLIFPYHNVLNRLLYTCFYAFIILTQNYTPSLKLQLRKIKFLNWSGKYTYGLYLLHPMGFFMVKCIIDFLNIPDSGFWIKLAIAFGTIFFTYIIAWLSYEYFEKKFLLLKNKFTIIKSGQ